MKEKKNIDRIFQEKFKDFEKEPNEKVWENISARLDEKDKKGPFIIPLWFKIGGVAAVLAIVLASLLFTNTQDTTGGEPQIVFDETEKSSEQEKSQEGSSRNAIEENVDSEEFVSNDQSGENESGDEMDSSTDNNSSLADTDINKEQNKNDRSNNTTNSRSKNSQTEQRIASNTKSSNKISSKQEDRNPQIIDNSSESNNSESLVASEKNKKSKDSIVQESILKEENALAEIEEQNKIKEEEKTEIAEANTKKMRLSTFAAPVIYKNIGSGNELSNQLANNSSSSEVTLSYGVKFAYKISDKLKIRTGISKIDINKNTQGILYSPSAMANGFENISPVEDNIEIRSDSPSPSTSGTGPAPLPSFSDSPNNALSTSIATPGELNQQFGYIEVPVEIEYALIDKKFGLNIIGGGSSLFLDNNMVQLVSGEMKTDLGEATNINNTSFSTNIGLGMDYKITDKFSINVEPIFKYQINTFDRVDNVQPVNFGVYSGLSFRF